MELNSVVAEWYLGLYPPEKTPMLAVWALEQGFDGPALRDLAGKPVRRRTLTIIRQLAARLIT